MKESLFVGSIYEKDGDPWMLGEAFQFGTKYTLTNLQTGLSLISFERTTTFTKEEIYEKVVDSDEFEFAAVDAKEYYTGE